VRANAVALRTSSSLSVGAHLIQPQAAKEAAAASTFKTRIARFEHSQEIEKL